MNDIPTVIIDGEPVLFDGAPPPPSVQALAHMLMAALNEQGRVLTKLSVDGVDALQAELPENAPYTQVDGETLSQRAFLLVQAQNQQDFLSELPSNASLLSKRLLGEPWEVSLKLAQEFAAALAPAVEVLEACQQFLEASGSAAVSQLKQVLPKIGPLLDQYSHCIEVSDSGLLAEQMLSAWVPWSDEVHKIFTEKLLPELNTAS